jgi:hypothetical protein
MVPKRYLAAGQLARAIPAAASNGSIGVSGQQWTVNGAMTFVHA